MTHWLRMVLTNVAEFSTFRMYTYLEVTAIKGETILKKKTKKIKASIGYYLKDN